MRSTLTELIIILVLSIVAMSGAPGAALAGNSQGGVCTSGAVTPIVNNAVTDGNNLICVSSVWQYPVYVLQSKAASAGSSCSTYPAGAMRYNTTLSDTEFCNGSTWQQTPAYSSSCGTPSGLSFTNVTNASLSTVYNSNTATITFTGCSGYALPVSVSGASTAQIRVNGGMWSTAGVISSGQTLQVQLTSSSSLNTTLTATVTVGGTSVNWAVTTIAGALKVFQTNGLYAGGSIGSLSNADVLCQTEANAAGYIGKYMAIMSSDTVSAASRLTLSYPIVNAYDGSTVAPVNLWAGSYTNYIKNPGGGSNSSLIWTGTTNAGGINTGETCSSWSNTSGTGAVGYYNTTYGRFFNYENLACINTKALYCISQ